MHPRLDRTPTGLRRHRPSLLTAALLMVLLGALGACQGQVVMTESPRPGVSRAGSGQPRGSTSIFDAEGHGQPVRREQVTGPPRVWPDDVPAVGTRMSLPEQAWREKLSEEQFHILRENGTERAGTGELLKLDEEGVYHCAGCNAPLFSSVAKFDSRTGWPSYYQPVEPQRVGERIDRAYGMKRIEVYCLTCGGHLGHVFGDGPEPTGLRYCINSAAMHFSPGLPPVAEAAEAEEEAEAKAVEEPVTQAEAAD